MPCYFLIIFVFLLLTLILLTHFLFLFFLLDITLVKYANVCNQKQDRIATFIFHIPLAWSYNRALFVLWICIFFFVVSYLLLTDNWLYFFCQLSSETVYRMLMHKSISVQHGEGWRFWPIRIKSSSIDRECLCFIWYDLCLFTFVVLATCYANIYFFHDISRVIFTEFDLV